MKSWSKKIKTKKKTKLFIFNIYSLAEEWKRKGVWKENSEYFYIFTLYFLKNIFFFYLYYYYFIIKF